MVKQQLIAKYAKKFANKPNSTRPVLEGIHYGHNGVAFVTNAEYALRLKNAHSYPEPLTIHAASGAPIDGTYPSVDKIFPEKFSNEIRIDQKELDRMILLSQCAADVASRINKKLPIVSLFTDQGMAYLRILEPVVFSAEFGNTQSSDSSKRAFNAKYLVTALSIFRDAFSPSVFVKFKDPLSPILVTDERDIDVLIMPIKTES